MRYAIILEAQSEQLEKEIILEAENQLTELSFDFY